MSTISFLKVSISTLNGSDVEESYKFLILFFIRSNEAFISEISM